MPWGSWGGGVPCQVQPGGVPWPGGYPPGQGGGYPGWGGGTLAGGTLVGGYPGEGGGGGTLAGGYPGQVPPGQVRMGGYPAQGGYPGRGGYPGQVTPPPGQVRMGGDTLPRGWYPGRTTEGVLTTQRAVCLLRSRRRTFLFWKYLACVPRRKPKSTTVKVINNLVQYELKLLLRLLKNCVLVYIFANIICFLIWKQDLLIQVCTICFLQT